MGYFGSLNGFPTCPICRAELLPYLNSQPFAFQDPGAAEWLKTPPLSNSHSFHCGDENHNLKAIQGWVSYFGSQLRRLILSTEIPGSLLIHYCEQFLRVPCEILGVGRILLFYTPRRSSTPLNLTNSAPEYNVSDERTATAFPFPSLRSSTRNPDVPQSGFVFARRSAQSDSIPSEFLKIRICALISLSTGFSKWIKSFIKGPQKTANTLKAQWPQRTTHGFIAQTALTVLSNG